VTYKPRLTTTRPSRQERKQARRLAHDPERHGDRLNRHEHGGDETGPGIDECPACRAWVPGMDTAELNEGSLYKCKRGCELAVALTDDTPPRAYLVIQEHADD
jgi:hypothetical protein